MLSVWTNLLIVLFWLVYGCYMLFHCSQPGKSSSGTLILPLFSSSLFFPHLYLSLFLETWCFGLDDWTNVSNLIVKVFMVTLWIIVHKNTLWVLCVLTHSIASYVYNYGSMNSGWLPGAVLNAGCYPSRRSSI